MLHGEILHNNLPLDCKNVFGGGGGGYDFTNPAAIFIHISDSTVYVQKLITIC